MNVIVNVLVTECVTDNTSFSVLFIPLSLLTYTLSNMLIIPLAPSGCPTTICSPFHSSLLPSALPASASQALKSGTLCPQLSKRTPIPSYFPPSSKNSSFPAGLPIPLAPSLLHLRFSLHWPLRTFINYIYLLTYLKVKKTTTEKTFKVNKKKLG